MNAIKVKLLLGKMRIWDRLSWVADPHFPNTNFIILFNFIIYLVIYFSIFIYPPVST